MLKDKKKIESVLGQITFISENLLYLEINKEMNLDKEDGVNFRNMILSLFGENDFSIIVDGSNFKGHVSMDAIQYFTQDEKFNNLCNFQAIIQNSLSVKLIANFYIQFASKNVQSKLFSDYDSALSWVLQRNKLVRNSLNIQNRVKG